MKKRTLTLLILTAASATAQQQEIGLLLGGVLKQDRSLGTSILSLGGGTSLHANYGVRIVGTKKAALYGAVNFIASPLRDVATPNPSVIRDFATIYLTPEARVKFAPSSRMSPFAFAGGGLAVYEHSLLNRAGTATGVPRTSNSATFTYGGGVDIGVWRWIGLRGEVRDNYSGSPRFNPGGGAGRQHNTTVAAGLVLRFGN